MKTKIKISAFILFFACNLWAQPKLVFDKLQHNYGNVSEGDGAAIHDFTFKNTGSSPLIIQDVKTTCGCTTPEWTKQPIRPGATGFIRVAYDVKGRPGMIDKKITVYSNNPSGPVTLHIIGTVTAVERLPGEAFRYPAGSIRLDDKHVSFNRVYSYEKPSLVLTAYNPGPDATKISFVKLPAYIKAEVTPATLKKGEKASIKITYDAARKNDWGFVTDRIYMILNDNKAKEYELVVTASIEEDFSRWTITQLQNAPAASVEQTQIDGGKIRKGEKKTWKVKLANTGKSKLLIRKVESSSPLLTVDAPKEINAGAAAEVALTYNSTGQSGEQSKSITVMTNDPKNAKIILRLKADVTE